MSSAFVSPFYDVGDVLRQNVKVNQTIPQQCTERRNTIGAPPMNVPRNRNFSIGNFTVSGNTPATACVISMDNQMVPSLVSADHRKLDRSYSEPCDRNATNNNTNLNQAEAQANVNNKPPVNSSRYKTELCRPFEESGHCKYADKCQFAHGQHELKQLQRHPKYKTELCRTFHTKGFCPYGPRCNFVHNEAVHNMNMKNNHMSVQQQQQTVQQQQQQQQPQAQPTQYFHHISPPTLSQSPPPIQRPTSINFNCSFNGSMGSTADSASPPSSVGSESPSLSPVFFNEEMNLNSCYSLPGNNNALNLDNTTVNNSSVFTNLSELASMDLPPLNIQTQMSDSEMGLLTQQFSALLNMNNHSNNNNKVSTLDDWDRSAVSSAPLSSPDSISGDSVGSTNSCSSSGSFSSPLCGSPAENGRSVRLPVFNHISQD